MNGEKDRIYIGTKIVLARPMEEREFARREGRPCPLQSRDGYRVVYEDGYVSWSPRETFKRAYREISENEISLIDKSKE